MYLVGLYGGHASLVARDNYDGMTLERMIALPDFLLARPNLIGFRFLPGRSALLR